MIFYRTPELEYKLMQQEFRPATQLHRGRRWWNVEEQPGLFLAECSDYLRQRAKYDKTVAKQLAQLVDEATGPEWQQLFWDA